MRLSRRRQFHGPVRLSASHPHLYKHCPRPNTRLTLIALVSSFDRLGIPYIGNWCCIFGGGAIPDCHDLGYCVHLYGNTSRWGLIGMAQTLKKQGQSSRCAFQSSKYSESTLGNHPSGSTLLLFTPYARKGCPEAAPIIFKNEGWGALR
jgi:hypothetical protein